MSLKNLTAKTLKFFVLGIAGLAIAITLSTVFGASGITIALLPLIWNIFWRVALSVFCLTSLAVVWESLK